ncbi:hypothetical protein VE03_10143 [Pseudogymnoascus sp. 23342-1-I1]|nr:hypothetical protein VE03_10143 [Pseudogymnoascus sp. 23342-1-I1]
MDYIRSFLGTTAFVLAVVLAFILHTLIHRQSPRPRPRPLNSSPLTLLPPEIIQHIASFLRPSAAASFASTCLFVRLTMGTPYLRALRASRIESFELLGLLLADAPNDPATNLPSRLICAHCRRLIPLYRGCGDSATPACREAWDLSRKYIESSFLPPVFHTAMAMHRQGRPSDALLAHITPTTSTSYHSDNWITSQHRARYHIATTGSLLLRRQITCILPYLVDGSNHRLHTQFCRHIGGQTKLISDAVSLVQSEARRGTRRSLSEFYLCIRCHTVVLLGARKFRGRGIGLFVTWWRDLGDGWANDEKWEKLTRPALTAQSGTRVKVTYNYMDVIKAFEEGNSDYIDFDGVWSPTDRKELLRLSPYKIGAGK